MEAVVVVVARVTCYLLWYALLVTRRQRRTQGSCVVCGVCVGAGWGKRETKQPRPQGPSPNIYVVIVVTDFVCTYIQPDQQNEKGKKKQRSMAPTAGPSVASLATHTHTHTHTLVSFRFVSCPLRVFLAGSASRRGGVVMFTPPGLDCECECECVFRLEPPQPGPWPGPERSKRSRGGVGGVGYPFFTLPRTLRGRMSGCDAVPLHVPPSVTCCDARVRRVLGKGGCRWASRG
ncbi:hypothetical protein B0I37DRAFT_4590 [Chaetomium sp. MPI-CAGE-AT-0009]|nr:hypothetical protein B0I37DRAFT_4590 [Chaetomium sp. MPI-CAGE-AT-0009]